jgi:hypothetical protein
MVDLTGIEPVIPCLQSTRLDSICSIHYRKLLTFPTNRGTCFSLIGILNEMNTLDSCTDLAADRARIENGTQREAIEFLRARRRIFENPDRRWRLARFRPKRLPRLGSPRNEFSIFDSGPGRRDELPPR